MNIFNVMSILSICTSFAALGFSLLRKNPKKNVYFIIFSFALIFYLIGDFLAINSTHVNEFSVALKVIHVGSPFIAPYFLLITACLFDYSWIKPWKVVLLTSYAFTVLIVVFTNDFHHLFYKDIGLIMVDNFPKFILKRGTLYHLNQGAIFMCVFNIYRLFMKNVSNFQEDLQKRYYNYLICMSVVLISYIANLLEILPFDRNPIPIFLGFMVFITFNSLNKYNLLDLEIIASLEAVECMDDSMILFNQDWGYVYSNLSAKKLVPTLFETAVDTNIKNISGMPAKFNKETKNYSFDIVDKRGNIKYYKAEVSPIGNHKKTFLGWSVIIRNTTEVTTLLQNMQNLAHYDSLTKIYNRRYFLEKLNVMVNMPINRHSKLFIIMVDLDHFKKVNDTYGHLVGDDILKVTANALKENMTPSSIIGRYGGEEFIIATFELDIDEAYTLAENLRIVINNIIVPHDDGNIKISASLGVGYVMKKPTIRDVIALADRALYEAKDGGRNRTIVIEG